MKINWIVVMRVNGTQEERKILKKNDCVRVENIWERERGVGSVSEGDRRTEKKIRIERVWIPGRNRMHIYIICLSLLSHTHNTLTTSQQLAMMKPWYDSLCLFISRFYIQNYAYLNMRYFYSLHLLEKFILDLICSF